jgi:hypothetical protein
MSKKLRKDPLIPLPLNISFDSSKTEDKQIVEFDPNKIEPGEIGIVKVEKWRGFSNKFFAVMNVEGKAIIIRQLDETKISKK